MTRVEENAMLVALMHFQYERPPVDKVEQAKIKRAFIAGWRECRRYAEREGGQG